MFRSSKRRRNNIEEYDASSPIHRHEHSDYTSRGDVYHQHVIQRDTSSSSSSSALPSVGDWSMARTDGPLLVEADIDLAEMEDWELEALGLSSFVRRTEEKTAANDTTKRISQSVSQFISTWALYNLNLCHRLIRCTFGPHSLTHM